MFSSRVPDRTDSRETIQQIVLRAIAWGLALPRGVAGAMRHFPKSERQSYLLAGGNIQLKWKAVSWPGFAHVSPKRLIQRRKSGETAVDYEGNRGKTRRPGKRNHFMPGRKFAGIYVAARKLLNRLAQVSRCAVESPSPNGNGYCSLVGITHFDYYFLLLTGDGAIAWLNVSWS